MEAEYATGTSVFVYDTTWTHSPEFHSLDYYYVCAKCRSKIGSIQTVNASETLTIDYSAVRRTEQRNVRFPLSHLSLISPA
jgi:hypothetical protein